MRDQPTVFVVDDDPSIRRALAMLFESEGLAVETFDSADALLAQDLAQRTGCLLLDVRMPGMSGLQLQELLARRALPLPIIIMTAHADVPMAIRAFKAGALDFIEKPFNEQRLLEMVHTALEQSQRQQQLQQDRHQIEQRLRTLTHRERQVLESVVASKTNRQIAEAWGISEKTVKIHRGRVMEKMQAKSLPDLVLMAQSVGICRPMVGFD